MNRLKRLLLLQDGLLLEEVALRSGGEVGLLRNDLRNRLGGGGLGGGSLATDHLLGLGGVVTGVLLGDLSGIGSVLAGNAAQLLGLRVDHIRSVLQVVVDKLLVGGVDERSKECDGRGNESKSPVGNNLDQVVRQESSSGNL